MGSRSLKKKPSKRSISQSDRPAPSPSPSSSSSSSSSSSCMASNHFSRFRHYNKGIPAVMLFFFFLCGFVLLCISSNMWIRFPGVDQSPSIFTIQVVNEFPHDPRAFTQGLLYAENDTLFESTGLYGRSSVRRVALETGKVEAINQMEGSYFGEGLTLLGEKLFQVTWLQKTGFIYDQNNLNKLEEFTHQMKDGWGLATDGKVLFGSDGSSMLYQIDPQTLKVIRKDIVRYRGREVRNLNELEFIKGEVWANVWQTDCIARISHEDGVVLGWVLLPNLRERLVAAGYNGIDVLNGIAWDSNRNRIFVTGKLWPKLYEINLREMKRERKDGFNVDTIIEQLCLLDGRL